MERARGLGDSGSLPGRAVAACNAPPPSLGEAGTSAPLQTPGLPLAVSVTDRCPARNLGGCWALTPLSCSGCPGVAGRKGGGGELS